MTTHSSSLAWRIPWTGEPGGLQSMGSQTVRHSYTTNTFPFMPFRKWLTDVLTTPGAPRCNQSSTQPPGSAPGRGQRASAAQDHRSSPAGRRSPRCLSLQPGRVQPGQADAATESLALSLSLSCSSQPGSLVSGGSTGGLLPHHLAPQADSSFCSAPLSLLLCFLYLSSVALHPPP